MTGAKTRDKITGKFLRTRTLWSLDNWNDGYIDNRGRFRVYYPISVNAYASGYILRSYVVWEMSNKKAVPFNKVIHHRDHNRLNDEIENLEIMTKKDHDNMH